MYQIPMKSFVEKEGTFINHSGKRQRITKGPILVSEALTLQQATDLLSGREASIVPDVSLHEQGRVFNELERERGQI